MPKLTITALNSDVNIQDPYPAEGQFSLKVAAGQTKTVDFLHWAQFQRIGPQLATLEAAHKLTYHVGVSPLDSRPQEADLEGLPNIDYLDQPTIAVAGQVGLKLYGPKLEGYGQIFATLDLGNRAIDIDAVVEVRALLPGYDGNKYSVEVVDTGGGGLTVAVAVDKITVDQGGSGSDATTVAAAINAHVTAKTMVFCSVPGTGANVVAVKTETNLAGGVGSGVTLTCGGFPCTITAITPGTPTEIVFDVPALAPIVASQIVALQLRANAKMYTLSVPTV